MAFSYVFDDTYSHWRSFGAARTQKQVGFALLKSRRHSETLPRLGYYFPQMIELIRVNPNNRSGSTYKILEGYVLTSEGVPLV